MTTDKIFEFYNEIKLGQNDICRRCMESNNTSFFSKPISIWKVGKAFKTEPNKILFVGKVHRGSKLGPIVNNLFEDVTNIGNQFLESNSWAYWSYTREIIKAVHGDIKNGKEKIAFTNLVKCSNSITKDRTTNHTKRSCLSELKVVWKEIEILKPTKIIFFTNTDYDHYILNFKPSENFKDIKNNSNKVKIGKKYMPWWNRVFFDENGKVFTEFLRIGHPERLKKVDFINKVSNWAQE
tara:strand:+ start:14703 stop:15416 length:714 start_codon:yes stop_codon:yes gene_type:complete